MNNNKIRHKTLKTLVEKYKIIEKTYGENGWLSPMYEKKLQIPISEIIDKLNISWDSFDAAYSKALKEKSYECVENDNHVHCCTIWENTFLHYNEKKYLKENSESRYKIWSPILGAIVGSIFTLLTTNIKEILSVLKLFLKQI
jgi:hypothetical protein